MIRYHTVITLNKGRCAFHQPEARIAIRKEKYTLNIVEERMCTVFFFLEQMMPDQLSVLSHSVHRKGNHEITLLARL